MKITVITPTYNEAENLPKLVSALFALPLDLHVLVVDDNSPDGTGQIADRLAESDKRVRVHHRVGKLGLRSAYLEGIQIALADGADVIVQMDADFSHDPAALADMAKRLETADVVLGSRYVDGGSVDKQWPQWRKFLSAFGNFYARTILGLPLHDVTTGYRMWRRATLEGMPLQRIKANGYIFLVEMIYWPTVWNIVSASPPFTLRTAVGVSRRCRSRSRRRRPYAFGRCCGIIVTCAGAESLPD